MRMVMVRPLFALHPVRWHGTELGIASYFIMNVMVLSREKGAVIVYTIYSNCFLFENCYIFIKYKIQSNNDSENGSALNRLQGII